MQYFVFFDTKAATNKMKTEEKKEKKTVTATAPARQASPAEDTAGVLTGKM